MLRKPVRGEHRSADQLKQHYEIERELAGRLRRASRQERTRLYGALYDELYRRVPNHPQLARKLSLEASAEAVASQMTLLRRFLKRFGTFLEIGPGDCALSFEVAKFVRQAYAVDVSAEITKRSSAPPNFTLVLSDGSNIPLPKGAINVVYSNQLIEHLHPEDALLQLKSIYDVMASGGIYLCITPNRLGGPWDISTHFDSVATGFHLKEYTHAELSKLFRNAGFRKIRAFVGFRGRYLQLPAKVMSVLERVLSFLPNKKATCRLFPFRLLMDIRLVGVK